MRIISIILLLAALLVASPAKAQVEDTNINTKFEFKDSLTKIVSFLTKTATPEIAEAKGPDNKEPEVMKAEEPKTPEEIKYETIMNRWKKKQAHMKAPQGKFIINASAYTAAADECGKSDGITSSGVKVKEDQTLACPPNFPFGTKIKIEGMGVRVCEDRGGAIKGNHIDIYMETKAEAFQFGRRNLEAEVVG
jgi:3D (Asp-Asp-Asp) domain-containing protein